MEVPGYRSEASRILDDVSASTVPSDSNDKGVSSEVKIVPSDGSTTISQKFKKVELLIVLSVAFRILEILLVFLDVSLLMTELFVTDHIMNIPLEFSSISLVIALFFLMDILFLLHRHRCESYFSDKLNILNITIIGVTLFSAVTYKAYEMNYFSEFPSLTALFQFLRLVILARLIQLFYQKRHLEKLARRLVAGNKRRYTNKGFDLDLTYVTEHVIAMSFPSSGRQSFYRNPIKEVVRFLDTTHFDHYRVYNLCSERSYDPKYFHYRVRRIMIDDHNVPTLKEMVLFSKEVNEWLAQHKSNTIVVHCKGGKGRTGTMVCVYLLSSKIFVNAKESLLYFGDRRTDQSSSSKYQGVETPSQGRYVSYFGQILQFYQGILPPRKVLAIKTFIIHSIHGVGKGNGSDLEVQIICQKTIFSCCSSKNCMIFHDIETDRVIINLCKCPALYDDVKVKFLCPGLPKYYDNCPFFFWFHTSFIKNNRLYLHRNVLDNLHKPTAWKIYGPEFAVEVCFGETCLFVH